MRSLMLSFLLSLRLIRLIICVGYLLHAHVFQLLCKRVPSRFVKNVNHVRQLIKMIAYSHIGGMQTSYMQALKALSSVNKFSRNKVSEFGQTEAVNNVRFSVSEESKITNYLTAGDQEGLNQLLENILKNNTGDAESGVKELCLQLYVTGNRTLRKRDILPEVLMGAEYIDFTKEYNSIPNDRLIDYVMTFYNKILAANNAINDKKKLTAIKEYIDGHYFEDLCLDSLARQFHATPVYLSRAVKEILGISFLSYLNNLRVDKAKELLSKTDMPVNEVAGKVGFNDRHTLTRVFKNSQGITPTTFRELNRDP